MDDWILDKIQYAALEVYNELGSGHTEAVYESAMEVEFGLLDLGPIRRQVPCPIFYKGILVGIGLIDILIDNNLVIEIKSINKLTDKDASQVRKYLSGTGLDEGILINFGPYRLEFETIVKPEKDLHVDSVSTED